MLGVFDGALTEVMAKALLKLGVQRALVVHGMDGLDEITTAAPTKVSELKDGSVVTYEIDTEHFGIKRSSSKELAGGDAAFNAEIVLAVLNGKKGPQRDIVLANAAAALYAGGQAADLPAGIKLAEECIDSGAALARLERLKAFTDQVR